MKWNVVNANSRDVERQHLNKILKEIESTSSKLERDIGNVSGSVDNVQRTINTTVTKIVNETLPLSSLITSVTLTGDVTGTSVLVPGSNAVTITTYLSEDYVQEAPIDNNYYWRFQGNWQPVPQAVINLQTLPDNGFIIQDTEGFWQSRVLESASSGNITITNPDGNEGNPVFDLSEIEPLEQGAILGLEFDEHGRRVGQRDVTTDDLTEGDDNLYYTDSRVDARIELQKGEPSGLAPLGPDGLLPSEFLPALAITEVYVVNSQAAQLALIAQEGDVAVRTDIDKNYIHNGGTTGTIADWTELLSPAAPVQSVNGKTGNVVLNAADVGAATAAQGLLADSALQSVTAGAGITVNNTDPRNPVVSAVAAPAPAHNTLTGLQGGAPGEYYHLSFEDYANRILPYSYLIDEAGNQLIDEAGNYLTADTATIPWSLLANVPAYLTSIEVMQTLASATLSDANTLLGVTDGRMLLITDLTGGREPCWYDSTVSVGTKWRRFSDRSIAN